MRVHFSVVGLAVSLAFVANTALAQKKDKADKKPDGPSAAETWTDPVENEKSDKPPEDDAAKPEPKRAGAPDPGRKRDRLVLFGQMVIGFGRAPLNQPSYSPGQKGTALGFQVGGRYDITKDISGGLRVPLTTATVKTGNQNLSTTVFGAPELFGEYRISLGRLTTVPISFGVGIPVAEGNPDRTDNTDTTGKAKSYVNQLADATTGWRDSELFQPKRLPIILGGGIRHERRDFELHADLKLVLLPALNTDVKVPEAENMSGTYQANGFALREVTSLGGSYNFLDNPLLYGGLDLAFVWTPIETFDFEPAVQANKPSTLQAVLEPKLGARFGMVSPSLGYILPLGGRLGDGDIGGVRLHLDVSL